jgi:acetoin utilization deacetylase AcuC-like enzyme
MSTAYLFDPIFMKHKTGYGHPERPERLAAINDAVMAAPYYPDLLKIKPSLPDVRYIEMIHSPSYIQRVRKEITGGSQYLDSMDTAVCTDSYDIALLAVGGSLNMCDTIMDGRAANGFCAIRPPGHHAEKNSAAGFCIFNNIAIAARYLQVRHGIGAIAIVDWDVHHGNGTQHSFESDGSILYISLHQYPYHYPGTGSPSETGTGAGKGFTLNIPMQAGSGDREYLDAFRSRILPRLDEFRPEILLISAGFDAHRSDPLSSIRLSSDAFGEFTAMLKQAAERHARSRMISFLEGGYDCGALAESVMQMMNVLVRDREIRT